MAGAGFGVDMGLGSEARVSAGGAAVFGVDVTTGLVAGALGDALAAWAGAGAGAAFGVGLGAAWGAGFGAAFGAGADGAFAAGLGAALGASAGAALGAGACLGSAFAWGAAGLPGLLLDSSAKAGPRQVINAKVNAISRVFAACCDLIVAMIGLLSSLSGFFTCQDIHIQGCRSIYNRRRFDWR